jgi:hypothetical protein
VVLALTGALAAIFGPSALQRARRVYAPISRMKDEQRDFEAWSRQRGWREPATPQVEAARLDAFLALRRELHSLDDKGADLRRRRPADGPRPRLEDVPAIVEGVGGLVAERLAAFRRHDMTPAEYGYLERLVYETWRRGLADAGDDPAARERAAHAIEEAAAGEGAGPVRARLLQVAAGLRRQVPPAPAGVPDDVHRLLLTRATEIESQPERVPARVTRPREDRSPPEAGSSPSSPEPAATPR